MTPELTLSLVNAVADALVVLAIGTVHRQRPTDFTRSLLLAFAVWVASDLFDVAVLVHAIASPSPNTLVPPVLFYNLSTLNSMFFLVAALQLRARPLAAAGEGRPRVEAVGPAVAAGLVVGATLALEAVFPGRPFFAVPELLFATFVTVVLGLALYRILRASGRLIGVLGLVTFGTLAGLLVGYLLIELRAVPYEYALPMRVASVVAHLLIIFIIANAVGRGLWRALEAEQQDLERLIESSPTAILVVDADGRAERVNATGKRLLGLAASDPRPITALLPGLPWDPARLVSTAAGAVLSEHLEVSGPDGSRHLRVYSAPFSPAGSAGRPLAPRYVLIATDIADELERERVALESERAKTLAVLSGGTIHHFHNKLLAIRTGLRFVQTRMPLEDGERLRLPLLLRATEQAVALSQQLAGSIRMAKEAGLETLDLRIVLREAVDGVRERRPEGCVVRIEDETGRPGDEPLLVHGVPGFVRMVFENLIANAFDAARPGTPGLVTVRLAGGDERIHVALEDNGTGVPDAARHQLFVPFFTTKEASGGSGFGLYWSRRLLEAMGGSLNLEWTEVGVGTRFALDLPVHRPGRLPDESGPTED